VPRENWQETFVGIGIEVIPVDDILQVIKQTFDSQIPGQAEEMPVQKPVVSILAASPAIEKSF
jgi:hypothetical protein